MTETCHMGTHLSVLTASCNKYQYDRVKINKYLSPCDFDKSVEGLI